MTFVVTPGNSTANLTVVGYPAPVITTLTGAQAANTTLNPTRFQEIPLNFVWMIDRIVVDVATRVYLPDVFSNVNGANGFATGSRRAEFHLFRDTMNARTRLDWTPHAALDVAKYNPPLLVVGGSTLIAYWRGIDVADTATSIITYRLGQLG